MDSTIKSTTKYIRLEKLFTANLFLCLFPSLVPKYKKCFFYERNGGYLIKKPPKRNFGGFYGQKGYECALVRTYSHKLVLFVKCSVG